VLALELLLGLARGLEHREDEGAAARRGGDNPGGEAEEGVFGGPASLGPYVPGAPAAGRYWRSG
jgi:hypothetical protein